MQKSWEIPEKDMEALAELISEKGYTVVGLSGHANFTFKAMRGQRDALQNFSYEEVIYIGQYGGMFVSTHYIHGFPMSPLGEGEMRYQIVL